MHEGSTKTRALVIGGVGLIGLGALGLALSGRGDGLGSLPESWIVRHYEVEDEDGRIETFHTEGQAKRRFRRLDNAQLFRIQRFYPAIE